MTFRYGVWKAGLSIGLAIPAVLWASGSVAQVRPIADETLGQERSRISPGEINGVPGDLITAGARRGANLFHSFQEFSIDAGRAAYFANPAGVKNILGRVTGGGGSEILGRLGVLGEANLFLINPNGIVFGPNASLDIGGSFLATTADAIGFGEEGWFSATTPETPSPLLTINPSAFFFNQISTSDIAVRAATGLSVEAGKNLGLLGGDITIEGGHLNAPGGRIDLGGVEGIGTIGLNAEGSFAFPTGERRGDIAFSAAAQADVRTPDRGGEIALTGRSISLTEESQLLAGPLSGQGTLGSQAGDIRLNATGQISLTDSSHIVNTVADNAQGNAGDVEIDAPILTMADQAQLNTSTAGQGNAGNVIIAASDRVTFNNSHAHSGLTSTAVGEGGNIEIDTPILEVLNQSSLISDTHGQGNAGDVIITASELVTFDNNSIAFSGVDWDGHGDGGDIEISTPILNIFNGGYLDTGIYEPANGGDVIITAGERVTLNRGAIYSNINWEGDGSVGNIEITTPILEILNGSKLQTIVLGQGNAGNVIIAASDRVTFNNSQAYTGLTPSGVGEGGNIEIDTPILEVLNGSTLFSITHGQGNTGDVIITASELVTFDGSFAFSGVDRNGDGGSIKISAPILNILNGGYLDTGIYGQANGGDVIITADERVTLNRGAIYSNINWEGDGEAGNIEITTPLLEILNQSKLQTIVFGRGTAGNVIITASDRVTFNDSYADSKLAQSGVGEGGNIEITTSILEVLNGSKLVSDTHGQGNAGDVIITASERVTFDYSYAFSGVYWNGNGDGGNIEISTPVLNVFNEGYLDIGIYERANGGDVIIKADERVTLNRGAIYSNINWNGDGEAGNIEIMTPILEVLNQSNLQTIILGRGNAGNVIITASDRVTFNNSYVYSGLTPRVVGEGGDIMIDTPILEVLNRAELVSDTHGKGDAGDVIITASELVTFDNSFAFSGVEREGSGDGGDIEIRAPLLQSLNGGQIITSTVGEGQAGNILINAALIHLSGHDPTLPQRQAQFNDQTINEGNGESGLFANTRADSTGAGGSITLNTTDLTISDRAQIVAQSEGDGDAGKVAIRAEGVVVLSDRSGIATSSQALGSIAGDIEITSDEAIILDNHAFIRSDTNGGQGDIDLTAPLLLLQDNSAITTNASGAATGGNIDIEADFIVAAPNENSDIFANAFAGSGGRITLTAQAIFGLEFRTRAELQQLLGDNPNNLTPRNLPSNDVTAFSQASPNIGDLGTVTFRTPDVDPSQGLVELSTAPLEVSNQITRTCPTGGGGIATSSQSEFVITGRGGLPPSPLALLEGDGILAGWATLDTEQNNTPISPQAPTVTPALERAIVEATAWSRDAAGNIVLIAATPAMTSPMPLYNSVHCQ